jgi:UMF1 family MFS transporter
MTVAVAPSAPLDDRTYRRRVNAWALYDVATSAFFTTIIAAVLPTYYSSVAGANLSSAAIATRNWSLSLSIALAISAVIAPVLGTVSDIARGKKPLLLVFTLIGAIGSGLLVLVSTGDWLLASILIVVSRIGVAGANVFYDALLPHVATRGDADAVSTRGYALGYLGGGVLLAINVVMINVIPNQLFGVEFPYAGIRLSFLSVAVWFIAFALPLLFTVPEPESATERLQAGENLVGASFSRLAATFRDVRQYSELFKYLIAFLIYNDGIGTIIGVAVIYGAELGFETTELILALLLVQFVGIPFSFIFGNLPNREVKVRHYYLAFILVNVVALPILGIAARETLPVDITGAPVPNYVTVGDYLGEGAYGVDDFTTDGDWTTETVPAELLGADDDADYLRGMGDDAALTFAFNGQQVELVYASGTELGAFAVELDGAPLLNDDGDPVIVDAANPTDRYGETVTLDAGTGGEHTLRLVSVDGAPLAVGGMTVLPPVRGGDLLLILGALLAVQAVAAVFAFAGGARMLRGTAERLTTKNSIFLALAIYSLIAMWGYVVDSTVEFWFLAWMVGIVQGGSQALSRSLYASMSPAAKSGEFFGLFSVMAKFSAITGPLLFAAAVTLFGNSRPAILSLIALFVIGGALLTRVDVEAGRRVAAEENARYMGASG